MYIPNEAKRRFNEKAVEDTIKALETGDDSLIPSPYQPQQGEAEVKAELAPLGNQRFFTPDEIPTVTWKQALEGLEWRLKVNISGEAQDKNTILTTLNTTLATVANPNYANNPTAQFVVGKILNQTGVVSPLELASLPQPEPAPALPAQPITQ
jgi:hypothetical protein